ncbi:MAG: glucuronyl hydrolase [Kiritimatiellia bacterium]
MTKFLMLAACTTTFASVLAAAPAAEEALRARLPEIFARSAAHYRALDAAAAPLAVADKPAGEGWETSTACVPHGFNRKTGKLDMRTIYWWTSGHFPGSLWYLYEATGDEFFKTRAKAWTETLAPNAKVTTNHDIGFIMYCSYGNARRLLGTDAYDGLLRETAASLCQRFSADLGLIRSWGDKSDRKDFLVIPDNMMNLELLEAAAKLPGGERRFADVARSHATRTMRHHFRADGGTYHVLNYDQRPGFHGAVQEIRRGQGLSCETAWSRGQSWAIYGYTMMYRETKDPAYLEFAQKVSDFAIGHPNMPADGVPYWDFGAPGEERDSSAASIMASGLLELSTFVGGEKGAAYRAYAVRQLTSLAGPDYYSEGDEIGHWLLKHGVGHKPAGTEIDTPLDYGDYYFLEALLRLRSM